MEKWFILSIRFCKMMIETEEWMMKKRKSMYISFILAVCLFTAMSATAFSEGGVNKDKYECDSITNLRGSEDVIEKAKDQIGDLLKTEEDIQYYAYLELESADPDIIPVILKARDMIIFRQAWVADGIQGFLHDENGDIIKPIPQFSELFPENWSVPVMSTEVDLSYYK